jgi:hypothetical protein
MNYFHKSTVLEHELSIMKIAYELISNKFCKIMTYHSMILTFNFSNHLSKHDFNIQFLKTFVIIQTKQIIEMRIPTLPAEHDRNWLGNLGFEDCHLNLPIPMLSFLLVHNWYHECTRKNISKVFNPF